MGEHRQKMKLQRLEGITISSAEWRGENQFYLRWVRWLANHCAITIALAVLIFSAMVLWWYPALQQQGYAPASAQQFFAIEVDKININEASLAQLQLLAGIGVVRAQAIIDWREQHGAYESLEDLAKIPGIGEKIIAGMKENAIV